LDREGIGSVGDDVQALGAVTIHETPEGAWNRPSRPDR
jgi:hypothetical protein